ncbi:MAG: hypothetical protein ACTSQC_08765 [Candidatus Heimdallarchaeaceae archaeon]
MATRINETEKLSFKNRVRRWFGKYFGSNENCSSQCSNCQNCPYIKNSNYTFEIKKRNK